MMESRASNQNPFAASKRGMALIELLVSIVMIGVGMTAIIRALDGCVRTSAVSLDRDIVRPLLEQTLHEHTFNSDKNDSGRFESPFERFEWRVARKPIEGTPLTEIKTTISWRHGQKRYSMEGSRLCLP
ncbi:MAG: prepilin-type N-terminal cleavage/methylation domain-containing protein [Candidatus Hydrogenedentes bacterium]|nr:prepilin-type N-terminal cleavage/methylation domain-containing protein [Candidatus Hydrogenedentota bacterium]